MKKHRKESLFLEQIETIPNISLACEKVGISRNTVYRWRKEDKAFRERLDAALDRGVDSVNDLAESKLIAQINSGNMQAIRYWLDNNKKNYIKPRSKNFWNPENVFVPVRTIKIKPAPTREEIQKERANTKQ